MSTILNLYFRYGSFRKAAWSLCAVVLITISVVLVFQNRRVMTNPVGWERSFQVSPFTVVAQNVAADSRDNFVAVAYEGRAGDGQGIYVSLSFNAGRTFFQSIKIADAQSRTGLKPAVAIAPNGTVSAAWDSYVEGESTNRIYFSTSKDMGAHWSDPRQIKLGTEKEMLPRIYYDERNVLHLFYHGSTGKTYNIFHAESAGGDEFRTTSALIRLPADMRGAFSPSIFIFKNDFYIVWQGREANYSDELFFMRSTNYGSSWTSPKPITYRTGNNVDPTVVMSNGILYVVYRNKDEKNWSVKMITSTDRGWSWDKPLTVSTTPANCYFPMIGLSDNDPMILWIDTRTGRAKLYSRRYSIRDRVLMPEAEISDARYESKHPVALSLGRKFFVFWEEKNTIMAKQTDIYAEPPAVFSETNPEGKWSRIPYVVIQWKPPRDESGIAGYAYAVNNLPDFNPVLVNLKSNVTQQRITDISDGISYFHIRAVDNANNYSRTIHYRLLVSANPLPGPEIASPTHQQGKPNQSPVASFSWAVSDMERVRGFVYSISKDTIAPPDKFTTDVKTQLTVPEEGNYFFSVAAVDRTNQASRVSTYAFIVGRADQLDPDYYNKIAQEQKNFEEKRYLRVPGLDKRERLPGAPMVVIRFPFDADAAYDKDSFKAIIVASNIRPDSIVGYSVYIDNNSQEVSDRVNLKGPVIDVKDLHNGEYYIGVMCKYSIVVGGIRKYYWTKPYIAKVMIDLPQERSPFVYYAQTIMGKFSNRFGYISLTFFGLSLVVTTLGFGKRIRFYLQLFLFKMKKLFQPIF